MTSNQVAYAATQEEVRHNTAVETETNRHNVATENLTEVANAIERDKVTYDNWYKHETVTLQRERNKLDKELAQLQASTSVYNTDRMYEINQRKNEIAQQEVNLKAEYQELQRQLGERSNELTEQYNAEIARHNQAQEGIENWRNTFQDRELIFKKYQFDEDIGLRRKQLEQAQRASLFDYYLGSQRNSLLQTQNEIMSSEVGAKVRNLETQTKLAPWQIFWNTVTRSNFRFKL